MGIFGESLDYCPPNLWESVSAALQKKNDGSYEEFLEAMSNKSIAAPSIQIALFKSTGIEVSENTVRRWRRNWEMTNG